MNKQQVLDELQSYATDEFERISKTTSNIELFRAVLSIEGLTDAVVEHLRELERKGSSAPGPILEFVIRQCIQRGIPLPKIRRSLIRWANLIALASAQTEDFSYGNVLVPSIDVVRLTPDRVKVIEEGDESYLLDAMNPELLPHEEIDRILEGESFDDRPNCTGRVVRDQDTHVLQGAIIVEHRGNFVFSLSFPEAYEQGEARVFVENGCLVFQNDQIGQRFVLEIGNDAREFSELLANPVICWGVDAKPVDPVKTALAIFRTDV